MANTTYVAIAVVLYMADTIS